MLRRRAAPLRFWQKIYLTTLALFLVCLFGGVWGAATVSCRLSFSARCDEVSGPAAGFCAARRRGYPRPDRQPPRRAGRAVRVLRPAGPRRRPARRHLAGRRAAAERPAPACRQPDRTADAAARPAQLAGTPAGRPAPAVCRHRTGRQHGRIPDRPERRRGGLFCRLAQDLGAVFAAVRGGQRGVCGGAVPGAAPHEPPAAKPDRDRPPDRRRRLRRPHPGGRRPPGRAGRAGPQR